MQGDKMIPTDLFEFAYVPDWYVQLDELTEIILPESWRFKKPTCETKNFDTPILERYINLIFRKQSIDHNTAPDTLSAQGFSILKMNVPAFIPDFTHRDIKQFMPVLKEIKNKIPL